MDYVVRREAAQAAGFLTGEALRLAVKPVHLTQGSLELLDPLAKSFRGRFLEPLGCHVRSLKAGPQPVLRTGLRFPFLALLRQAQLPAGQSTPGKPEVSQPLEHLYSSDWITIPTSEIRVREAYRTRYDTDIYTIYHDRGCAILFCTTYFFSCDACASVWMLSYFIEGLGIAAQALSI